MSRLNIECKSGKGSKKVEKPMSESGPADRLRKASQRVKIVVEGHAAALECMSCSWRLSFGPSRVLGVPARVF
jgi:hypothetical protein